MDVNGDYEPDNVRWATKETQMNNRTNTRYLTHAGETLSIAQWSRRTGISEIALRQRLDQLGWNVRDALTKRTTKARVITHAGLALTWREWTKHTGLKRTTLHRRIAKGWSIARALDTPIRGST